MEAHLSGSFVTPSKGLQTTVFLTVPPTPVRRFQDCSTTGLVLEQFHPSYPCDMEEVDVSSSSRDVSLDDQDERDGRHSNQNAVLPAKTQTPALKQEPASSHPQPEARAQVHLEMFL